MAVLVAAAGALAALVGLRWTGTTEAELGPGRVEISAVVAARGQTSIALPPLGRVSAHTHDTPVSMEARVVAVDVDQAQRATLGPDPLAALRRDITNDLPSALRRFAWHTLAWAAAAGALAGLLVPGRKPWHALPGAAGGLLAVSLLLGTTWVRYDLDAFQEPTLEGELVRAPGLITAAQRGLDDIGVIRGRVETLSDRLAELYAASVGELPSNGEGQTSILHVSDIHLNPLAATLVVDLADDLGVDAILDTGDITSFGLPLEAHFGEILAAAPVPYLLVPGNHDSAANRTQLGALDGITILDGTVATVGQVEILGVADPTFTASNEVSTEEANAAKEASAPAVGSLTRRLDPDVLAVHDVRQATDAFGDVPLVVAGHTHQRQEEVRDGTRVLIVGSTGATGLGSFTVETEHPYEAEVLRFDGHRLIAVDYLTVEGIGGSFTLERRLVEPLDERAPADDDVPGQQLRPAVTSAPRP